MIKRIGFYREFESQDPDASAPSIRDAVRPHALYDESRILEYMSSGVEIFSTMGADRDVISSDEWISGAGSLVTDGTWLWPVELQHYVHRYHVELPEEFLTDVRGSYYTVPAVSSVRAGEIVREVFGPSAFRADGNGVRGAGGFFAWYLSDLNAQSWGRLLGALKSAGLNTRHRLTGDMVLSRTDVGGEHPRPVENAPDVAALLADPGDGEVALHLWFASDTYTVVRVRRLDGATTAVVYDLAGLMEPEREQVVAALVRALHPFRDDCQGFVLDRAGRSSRDTWNTLILEHAWPSEPFPDSVAVDTDRGARPPASDVVTRTAYGHLTVFNRSRTDDSQA
ncbi:MULTISPECIES: hypothetical protein [unclassified Streptomyces]|uniref:hypothetical protein n=1 Tax=unclassified Streptomyces TaxID=2593676 RepID=UPI0038122B86